MRKSPEETKNILQFNRFAKPIPQPIIEVECGALAFKGSLKQAIDFIQTCDITFDLPVNITHLVRKIQDKLLEHGVITSDLECVEPNPFHFATCPSCGQIGDPKDRQGCCDGSQMDDEGEN